MTTEMDKANQAIKQLLLNFVQAWNIHDEKAFSGVFAEDADFTNVFGHSFHGRPAIEAQHASVFSTIFKLSRLTVIKTGLRFINHNLAAVDVVWNMSGATDGQGNPWPDRKGLMNLILKDEEGRWAILIMHNMDLPVTSLN